MGNLWMFKINQNVFTYLQMLKLELFLPVSKRTWAYSCVVEAMCMLFVP